MTRPSPRRSLVLALSWPLLAVGFAVGTALAAGPMCHGLTATVVLTAAEPDYTDPLGLDDVVFDADGVANQVDTGDGADTVCSGGGDDTIDVGPGDDFVDAGGGHDTIRGGPGDDILRGRSGRDTVFGGDGDDALVGGAGDDELHGEAGNDHLSGQHGDDTLFGGDGRDRIIARAGNDVIDGGPGNDQLIGGTGNDTIDGGDGNDVVRGQAGRDVLRGGPGADRILGGNNADQLFGGDGDDFLRPGEGDETLGFGNPYRNDKAYGEGGNDFIVGGSQRDWLWGGPGVDRISGRGGNDIIVSGPGADVTAGGDGHDQIWAGATTGVNGDVDAVANGGPGFDACESAAQRVACEDLHGQRDVEFWRPLVTEVFTSWGIEQEIDNALAIIRCESVGDPFSRNTSSDTRGLFQHRPFAIESQAPADFFWGARVHRVLDFHLDKAVGFPTDGAAADPFDPVHNTNMAALLVWESVNHPDWGGPWGDSFAWYPWGHWHCGEITYGLWAEQTGDESAWLIPNEY